MAAPDGLQPSSRYVPMVFRFHQPPFELEPDAVFQETYKNQHIFVVDPFLTIDKRYGATSDLLKSGCLKAKVVGW